MACCVGKRLQKQVHKILFLHIYFGCFEEFIYRYEKLRVVQKGKPLQAAEFSLFQSLPCLVRDASSKRLQCICFILIRPPLTTSVPYPAKSTAHGGFISPYIAYSRSRYVTSSCTVLQSKLPIDFCGVLTRPAVVEVRFMHANHTYHIFFKYKIYLCRGGQRLLLHIMPYL
jgi:hypothetical protein